MAIKTVTIFQLDTISAILTIILNSTSEVFYIMYYPTIYQKRPPPKNQASSDILYLYSFLKNGKKITPTKIHQCLERIYKHKNGIPHDVIKNYIIILLLALATLNYTWEQIKQINKLQNFLLNAIMIHAEKFNSQDIAKTLWALAKLGLILDQTKGFFKELLTIILFNIYKNLKETKPEEIADTLWALAKLGCTWKQIGEISGFQNLLLNAIKVRNFKNQERTKIQWALKKLGLKLNPNCPFKNRPQRKKKTKNEMLFNILNLYRLSENIEKNYLQKTFTFLTNICKYKNNMPSNVETKNIVMLFSALARLGLKWNTDLKEYQIYLLEILNQCKNEYALNSLETVRMLQNLVKLECTWKQINKFQNPLQNNINNFLLTDIKNLLRNAIHKNSKHFSNQDANNVRKNLTKLGLNSRIKGLQRKRP